MPSLPVISNNTPLSALWSIGQLNLLRDLFGTVLIPSAVAREFLAAETAVRTRVLTEATWLIETPLVNPAVRSAYADLDDGEAEVLTLAMEQPPRLVIIDERRARAYAKRLQLPLTGTAGILLLAKRKGLLETVKPHLNALLANGFYLHPMVVAQTLTLANEADA